MSGEFDVFDEWGNYVGKYTPAGGGFDGILFLIALLFLWTIGFFVYTVIRLTAKGFEAFAKGERSKALQYWLLPGFLVGALCLSLIGNMVSVQAQEYRETQIKEEVSRIWKDPSKFFVVNTIQRGIPYKDLCATKQVCDRHFSFYGENALFVEFQFQNNTSLILVPDSGNIDCRIKDFKISIDSYYYIGSYKIQPRETVTFYCLERHNEEMPGCSSEIGFLISNRWDKLPTITSCQ